LEEELDLWEDTTKMFRLTRRQFSSTAKTLSDLYLHPEKWSGKPAQEILELFQKRRSLLGPHFKTNDAELAALKSTSSHTGVAPHIIERLYYGGELAAYDMAGLKFEDNYSPPKFQYDEYPEAAQEIIRDHREQREYNRIAAYEMPHLAKYRQEYKPQEGRPVTYKYTTYLGEENYKANKKVTLTVKVSELGLNDKESHKLKVLAGVRYDGTIDQFKLSCERFDEPLQNARFLSDVLSSLIKESKHLKDDFSDIPLDQRHVQARERKRKNKKTALLKTPFPEEWKRPQDAPKKEKTVMDTVMESSA
jgi:small subunit ribosomal protein S35